MNKLYFAIPIAIILVGGIAALILQDYPPATMICEEPKINVDNVCVCPDNLTEVGDKCIKLELDDPKPVLEDPCKIDPGAEGCDEGASGREAALICDDPLVNVENQCVCPNEGWKIEKNNRVYCLDVREPITEEEWEGDQAVIVIDCNRFPQLC